MRKLLALPILLCAAVASAADPTLDDGTRVGAPVTHAKRLMHGKPSTITHDGGGVYTNLPPRVEVGRYHSLAAFEHELPDALAATSRADDGELMGVRHRDHPIEGVQFHPELKSRPFEPHPLFSSFIGAAVEQSRLV